MTVKELRERLGVYADDVRVGIYLTRQDEVVDVEAVQFEEEGTSDGWVGVVLATGRPIR